MTINKRIEEVLGPLNVPLAFQVLPDDFMSTLPRITYFCLNAQGVVWEEDLEKAREYTVQVDIWHNADYSALVAQVQDAMEAADFGRGYEHDLFELEGRIFHKIMRFYYTEFR